MHDPLQPGFSLVTVDMSGRNPLLIVIFSSSEIYLLFDLCKSILKSLAMYECCGKSS